MTTSDGAAVGSGDGIFDTNSAGEIVIEGLEPGTTVTAREISTVEGFVLDGEPKTVKISVSQTAPELIFWNERVGTLVIQKKSTTGELLSGAEFLLTYADGRYVDAANGHLPSNGLYTTDSDGRATLQLEADNYYAVETECPKEYKLDSSRHTFTVRDGKNTTLTVENKAFSGILIHKTSSTTGEGLYGVTFLLYDSANKPIGQYTSDDQGYVYIEGLTDGGRYYL